MKEVWWMQRELDQLDNDTDALRKMGHYSLAETFYTTRTGSPGECRDYGLVSVSNRLV